MAGDSKQNDVLRQISQAWQEAQAQLRQLRETVERNSELAQLQAEGVTLTRERDRALRDLGEAVWNQVKRGALQLPESVDATARMVELVERKAQARAASITALLRETEVVAPKAAPRGATKDTKTLAARTKKR